MLRIRLVAKDAMRPGLGEAVVGRLVQIHVARDIPHAYLLKGALEESGIDAKVGNEELQMGIGELPAFSTAPIILVDESNAVEAAQILQDLEESQRRPRGDK